MGQYLRTNWRQTSNVLNTDALAAAFKNASIIGSVGADRVYPLVFFSCSGTTSAGGNTVNAYSIMSAFFGSTVAQQVGEGFRILPIGLMHRMLVVSNSLGNLWFSMCTSDDSAINFVARDGSITGVSFSYDLVFAGFIISTP